MTAAYGFFSYFPTTTPDENWGDSTCSVSIDVNVSNEVAFVGASSPFDPNARLFLKVKAGGDFYLWGYLDGSFRPANCVAISTWPSGINYAVGAYNFPPASEITQRLVFKLKDSAPSCPFYGTAIVGYPYSYLDGTIQGTEDFVIEAKEWWPYAKDSPPVPIWNTTNGAKL